MGIDSAWTGALVQRLERDVLPLYILRCRWFGGKGRIVRDMRVVENVALNSTPEAAHILAVEVAFTDGLPETYLVPLVFTDGEAAERLVAASPLAIIARFEGGRVLCDAFHLPDARADLLRAIAARGSARGVAHLVGTGLPGISESALAKGLTSSRIVGADQSNTAIIYDEVGFLKFFRKFERGPHPDLDVTRYLGQRGFPHVPTFQGALRLADPSGDGAIAMLVGFTQNQGDGWSYTLDALSRFFERVLGARTEISAATAAEQIGGVYPERARQLGQRTAELHLALAAGEGIDFAPEPFSTLYQRSLYQAMRGSAGRVLRQLRRQLPSLAENVRAEATAVADRQGQIFESFTRLHAHKMEATKIRIHGDYHLGQVLNTGKDFVIIDFEGEPRLALGERVLKRSPLRDVAGMLRSFDYAAAAALRHQAPTDHARLEPWARAWVQTVCASFLEAYFATARTGSFLPLVASDTRLLLEAFLLDKAVYEIGYELSYRPDFLAIPVTAVLRLLSEPGGGLGEF